MMMMMMKIRGREKATRSDQKIRTWGQNARLAFRGVQKEETLILPCLVARISEGVERNGFFSSDSSFQCIHTYMYRELIQFGLVQIL